MRCLALLMCIAACGTDDANAAGDYSIVVTNGDNGCNFASWTAGSTATAAVTVTQGGNNVTASVTGLGAVVLDAAIGGHAYSGKISGGDLDLRLFGSRTSTAGNCTYTFNSEIHAVLDRDALTGHIDYVSATNNNPDCAGITGCRSSQEFTGTRPTP